VNENSFEKLARYADATEIIFEAAAANPNPNPMLKAAEARMRSASATYKVAHKAVLNTASSVDKEVGEAITKIEAFRRTFDALRGVLTTNAPHEKTGPAASQYPTPLDLLRAASRLGEVLGSHGQEPWATELVTVYTTELASVTREWTEASEIQNQQQALKAARRVAADELSGLLVEFRQIVRAVFGPSSRQYHSIKPDRRNDGAEDGADAADGVDNTTKDAASATSQTGTDPATPAAGPEVKKSTDKAA
jgi:hypothetical protein